MKTMMAMLLVLAPMAALPGCAASDAGANAAQAAAATIPVTIESAGKSHVFTVETAKTTEEQARGLMYRTDLKPDGGMLFWPYPPEGGAPREASFWMKNTPTPLDIVYIRADGTIAHIAENTVPFSESPIPSGEPVGAVLELVGGRTSELGIAEGDRVRWTGGPGK
ncbi:hypothetical protein ASE75_00925 [Sphingomonas sp. Leaf17]|uniref:DUF192 domain-containing protein n=1 Tax=Sphingomonas sp. Leaf17 TaxID=1735683 RepID=UPI0006F7532A|nr:DUF192 domain-containing protein [Sphingomonas sp. Leaf17]KQM67542.1 hypothetical protein ASE75_00925 [Sphingomonas sp. Leaf17]